MINCGFGETHVNGLLAALNIPTITQTTLKSREREIAPQLKNMVIESCSKQLDEEIKL